jgi:hypothetical protein
MRYCMGVTTQRAFMPSLQAPTPAFKTKDGWLTPYALGCGYIETAGDEDDAVILDSFAADKQIYRVSWWEGNYRKENTYRLLKVARQAFKMVVSMKKRVPSLSGSTVTNC